MKNMKKPIAVFILLIMLFSLCSCEEYIGASGGGGSIWGDGDDDDGGTKQPELNDDPTDDFTVTVKVNGQDFSPRMSMDVYWSDGHSVHVAPLNKYGVARIDGLDGDYRVTLSAVPNEYTYNPNEHIATNDNRDIVLNLYPLNVLTGGGTGMYDCYKFSATGVYSAVIEKPGDAIFFEYAPAAQGVYTIESWIDVTEDSINPYIDVYGGTSVGMKWKESTLNDGGPVGSYTVNFLYSVQIVSEQISSGGQAVYTFAVQAESKYNKYPITVTFAVKLNDEIEPTPLTPPSASYGMAVPKFDFSDYDVNEHEYDSSYSVKYPQYTPAGKGGTYVFDQKLVKLWEKSKGGDGFYHMYDEEKYSETGGYGPILYAYITSGSRFVNALYRIEYRGTEVINNALSVGGYNYKHFIEGYDQLTTYGNVNGGSYYCSSGCSCHDSSVSKLDWACTDECSKCLSSCRRIPKELVGVKGYAEYANSDGVVPVTAELKEFLYHYANSPRAQLFRDGAGYIDGTEWSGGIFYQAPSGSEWLFACMYYEKK